MYNHYNPRLKKNARELRNESVSKAEKFIWKHALSRNQMGVKFKRQRPINNYIVDFFSAEIGLIIEVDGSSHFNTAAYDFKREKRLKELGYTMLRFTEGDVLINYGDVITQLQHVIYCLKEESTG